MRAARSPSARELDHPLVGGHQLGHVRAEHPHARRVGRSGFLALAQEPLAVVRPALLEDRRPLRTELQLLDRPERERHHLHQSILKPNGSGLIGGTCSPIGDARELRLHAVDPSAGAIGELVVVVQEPAARDHDAQIGSGVTVMARPGDPQVERLVLVRHRVPVGLASRVRDRIVVAHAPHARDGSPDDPLHAIVRLLEDELRPVVDVLRMRPSIVQLVDVDLVLDVHELEQMEQEQRHVAVGDRGDVRDARCAGHPRVELAQVDLAR